MKTTRQQKKDKAIELMKQLDIYKPYIQGFKQSDKVCFYERFGGFWVDQEPEIEAKMHELEKEYNCVVYAITHEITNIGELYDFLLVSNHKCDWDNLIFQQSKNEFIAFAYVWNKDDNYLSALWNLRWYENNTPPNRKTGLPINDVTWVVLPIVSYLEYKWLWRGCPF